MLIATPLIGQAFGPISMALIDPKVVPPCVTLHEVYGTKNVKECLRIDCIPQLGYWFNVCAVV